MHGFSIGRDFKTSTIIYKINRSCAYLVIVWFSTTNKFNHFALHCPVLYRPMLPLSCVRSRPSKSPKTRGGVLKKMGDEVGGTPDT